MAAAAATLPNDLIIDILSRAPAWSVCQFRCVSKEWRVLIADPAFAAEHGSRHAAEPYVVATHLRGNYSSGIVQDLQMLDMEGNVMRTIKGAGGSGLISPSVGDLICIADSFKNPDASCRVVDLVTRNVAAECPKLHVEPHHRWAPRRRVALFDLESEEWKEAIKGPPPRTDGRELRWNTTWDLRITELNNALCMVQCDKHMVDDHYTNIWLLIDSDKNVWIKAYTIPMAPTTCRYVPLRMTHDANRLTIYCTHLKQGELLQVHHPQSNECTTLRKLDKLTSMIGLCSLQLDRFVSKKM
ncbi:hypothetical protein BRADI_3g02036v3 [Brachypodium distachyon]|uniref:F-box domain-containing protein n=1 Tax=Brachypodium distachyon TaxID=15368 RepID=A0A0Q3EZU8_BRADI|nr:hypothetical protein BRADI_3g02036v3 [Brachypodium distachyon]